MAADKLMRLRLVFKAGINEPLPVGASWPLP
jgi:hypothetical protein